MCENRVLSATFDSIYAFKCLMLEFSLCAGLSSSEARGAKMSFGPLLSPFFKYKFLNSQKHMSAICFICQTGLRMCWRNSNQQPNRHDKCRQCTFMQNHIEVKNFTCYFATLRLFRFNHFPFCFGSKLPKVLLTISSVIRRTNVDSL